jgi:hypothetical protein
LNAVLFFSSACKFLLLKLEPDAITNIVVKSCFQLSFFLFIPVFAMLVVSKYRYGVLSKNELVLKRMPQWLCITTLVFVFIIDFFLFAYLLIGERI